MEGVLGVGGLAHLVERLGAPLEPLVVGRVDADPVEPRREERAAAKARKPEPGTDKGLLDGVSRLVGRAERSRREREEAVLVSLDELLERPAVSSPRPLDQRCVRIFHA